MPHCQSLGVVLVAALVLLFLSGKSVGAAGSPEGPNILFLTSDDPDNYEATKTLPVFAEKLSREYGCQCTVIVGDGEPNRFHFEGIEEIKEADLLVIFFRRRALSTKQIGLIRSHLYAGKPLVGIRTANHAFSVRTEVPDGYEKWWEFVPDVLGCKNRGYGKEKDGTTILAAQEAASHPILTGVRLNHVQTGGALYLQEMVDPDVKVLLRGLSAGHNEPIAWTRHVGKSRLFYTSLGHPSVFQVSDYNRLLVNGIFWALDLPVPAKT